MGAYGLGNGAFGDAHAAVAYVSTVMTMQSGGLYAVRIGKEVGGERAASSAASSAGDVVAGPSP